jgi:dihydrofolate synthase/folylpolyglutamate synthase
VTLLACEWFARVGVDVAVVEVGLGGRLDATNLVRPVVTAITTIARDHEAWLGHDLAAIAGEKAGIVKPGVPLAMGVLPAEAAEVVVAAAAGAGAPLVRVGAQALLEDRPDGLAFRAPGVCWDGLGLGLPGRFQRDNAAVALATLALLPPELAVPVAAVRRGLLDVRWPGRLAVVGRNPVVVLDGAHNPAGVAALAGELPAVLGGRRAVLLFAAMADKAWAEMLAPLLPLVARVIVTRVGRRGADPEDIVRACAGRVCVEAIADPRAALAAALSAAGTDGAVVAAGSLFLVGEVYAGLEATRGRPLFEPWHGQRTGGTEAAL